jgi:Chalcone isomerase-like
MSRRRALLALALAWIAAHAQTTPPVEVAAELPGARLLGRGGLSFMMLHIYDARLWVADGFKADDFAGTSLALELEYARTLYGELIAQRSLKEMKRQGGFSDAQAERWLAAMKQVFPDVAKSDRLTGVLRPGESAQFFLNGKLRGEIRDADFARRFFGIWLSPQTSEPKLRQALLGMAGS